MSSLLPAGAHSPFSCVLLPLFSSSEILSSLPESWLDLPESTLLLSPAPLLLCEISFTLFLTLVTFSDKIGLCVKTHQFCNVPLIAPLETSPLLSGLIAYI